MRIDADPRETRRGNERGRERNKKDASIASLLVCLLVDPVQGAPSRPGRMRLSFKRQQQLLLTTVSGMQFHRRAR